ncbi:hypothetical protein JX266_008348 [Neoarthrinium moseri]|nr:hypothetical protein JX266_008348 [Neoarthrinium moseri]
MDDFNPSQIVYSCHLRSQIGEKGIAYKKTPVLKPRHHLGPKADPPEWRRAGTETRDHLTAELSVAEFRLCKLIVWTINAQRGQPVRSTQIVEMANRYSELSPRPSRTCDHCKARKVRCIVQNDPSAYASSTPQTQRNGLYIDRVLENPGHGGVSMNDCSIFKIHGHHLTSSNLAVFSENRLRLISQRLGHNQVQELIDNITDVIKTRATLGKENDKVAALPLWSSNASTAPFPVSKKDASAYIAAYFNYIHPSYPFLDRQEFELKVSMSNLNEFLETQAAFSALYHAVLALGCQYVGECLQAVTAMSIFGISLPGMHIEDTLIIEAARIAIRLGSHRGITAGGAESLHYKAFWVIYVLERMTCFFYGKSPVLADYDIGCPIPDTPESEIEGVNFFVIILRGCRILSKTYQMLFSASATMNTSEQYFDAVDLIKADIERWTGCIPEKFRPGMPFVAGNTWFTFMLLRLHGVYHALVISLCRLELHVGADQQGPRMAKTRKLLMNTARTVLQLTTYIDLKPYTPLWMLGTIPCSATFILFDFIIHNPTHPETEANLTLLDMAAGYFGRLQYATGGDFPAHLMSGFAQIATDFVRRTRFESSKATPIAVNDLNPTLTTEPSVSVQTPLDVLQPSSFTKFSLPEDISTEPLFYPVTGFELPLSEDSITGFNFSALFDSMMPEFRPY